MIRYLTLLIIFTKTLVNTKDLRPLGLYNNIVSHTYYTLSYSEADVQAEWVYYTLNSKQLNSDIRYIQSILGRSNIKTTQIYTHVSNAHLKNIQNPSDNLIFL